MNDDDRRATAVPSATSSSADEREMQQLLTRLDIIASWLAYGAGGPVSGGMCDSAADVRLAAKLLAERAPPSGAVPTFGKCRYCGGDVQLIWECAKCEACYDAAPQSTPSGAGEPAPDPHGLLINDVERAFGLPSGIAAQIARMLLLYRSP